jgi:hypothetical protein
MRNYSRATVAQTESFRSKNYSVALEWARTEQKSAPANVSYTVGKEGDDTIVTKHEGFSGGQPPYQPLVHNSEVVNAEE